MVKACLRWLKMHPKSSAASTVLVLLAMLNYLAYRHARAMTHFVAAGERTQSPEALSLTQKAQVLLAGVSIPKPRNAENPATRGMLYQTHQFPGAADIEFEAWHIPRPDARGLCIMFHGYANCKSSLLPEAQAWHALGYETFLVDFRGCGGTSGWETSIGFHEAQDVHAAYEYVRRELHADAPVLFGSSMGAVAILRAVSQYAIEPQALVVECPFDRLLSTTRNRFTALGVPSFPCAELLVFWGGIQQGYWGFSHNPVEYARAVPSRVLMFSGERDPRVTQAQASAIFAGFPGEKRLVLFPETGHQSCLSGDPIRWKREIRKFLDD